MLLLFPVVGSGLSSVDTGFGDGTWLLDWILGSALVMCGAGRRLSASQAMCGVANGW